MAVTYDDGEIEFDSWDDLPEDVANKITDNVATSSNYKVYDYSKDLKDIKNQLSDINNFLVGDTDSSDTDTVTPADPVVLFESRSNTVYPDNTIVYRGKINGTEHLLFIPYDFYDDLTVIDGYLFNISNNTIFGRLDEIDPQAYLVDDYYLSPLYGSPSSVYNYGSYNYIRDYYVSNSRLTYNTIYGDFQVLEVVNTNSINNQYKIHLSLLIIITMLGVMLLCYWKKFRR